MEDCGKKSFLDAVLELLIFVWASESKIQMLPGTLAGIWEQTRLG